MPNRIEKITQRLQSLQPSQLNIVDESEQHMGHAGAQDGRGHFALEIAAPSFAGQSPIACHRMIYAALGELMQTDIHALKINILASNST